MTGFGFNLCFYNYFSIWFNFFIFIFFIISFCYHCSCGGPSGARCLDCMTSLIESDVSRECHVGVLLMLASLKHNFHYRQVLGLVALVSSVQNGFGSERVN